MHGNRQTNGPPTGKTTSLPDPRRRPKKRPLRQNHCRNHRSGRQMLMQICRSRQRRFSQGTQRVLAQEKSTNQPVPLQCRSRHPQKNLGNHRRRTQSSHENQLFHPHRHDKKTRTTSYRQPCSRSCLNRSHCQRRSQYVDLLFLQARTFRLSVQSETIVQKIGQKHNSLHGLPLRHQYHHVPRIQNQD